MSPKSSQSLTIIGDSDIVINAALTALYARTTVYLNTSLFRIKLHSHDKCLDKKFFPDIITLNCF